MCALSVMSFLRMSMILDSGAKTTVPTWGRIDVVLGCAFDLFRFAMAWLGAEPGTGRRESDNGVDLSDRPRSLKLPTRLFSFSYSLTQRKNGFCSSRLPQKGTFLPMI